MLNAVFLLLQRYLYMNTKTVVSYRCRKDHSINIFNLGNVLHQKIYQL